MRIGDTVTIEGAVGVIVAIGNFGGPDNVCVNVAGVKSWHKADAIELGAPVEDKVIDGPKRGRKTK